MVLARERENGMTGSEGNRSVFCGGRCVAGRWGVVALGLLWMSAGASPDRWQSRLDNFLNREWHFTNGVYLTVSNYSPAYVFKDREAARSAMDDQAVRAQMRAVQVSQVQLFADARSDRFYCNVQEGDQWNRRIFTNRTGMVFGRAGSEWWMLQRHGVQVLRGSGTGLWIDVRNGQTNRFFQTLHQNATDYCRLGLPPFVRGSFVLSLNPENRKMNWRLEVADGAPLTGEVEVVDDTALLKWVSPVGGRVYQSSVAWDDQLDQPRTVNLFWKAADGLKQLRAYHLRGAVHQEREPSDWVYRYASHTNGGDIVVYLDRDTGVRTLASSGEVLADSSERALSAGLGVAMKRAGLLMMALMSFAFVLWNALKRRHG